MDRLSKVAIIEAMTNGCNTPKEIAEELGHDSQAVSKMLFTMKNKGLVFCSRYGQYSLIENDSENDNKAILERLDVIENRLSIGTTSEFEQETKEASVGYEERIGALQAANEKLEQEKENYRLEMERLQAGYKRQAEALEEALTQVSEGNRDLEEALEQVTNLAADNKALRSSKSAKPAKPKGRPKGKAKALKPETEIILSPEQQAQIQQFKVCLRNHQDIPFSIQKTFPLPFYPFCVVLVLWMLFRPPPVSS